MRLHRLRYLILPLAAALFIAACGGGGEEPKAPAIPTPATPSIAAFSAAPTTITAGDNCTLTWSVSNATSVELDGTVVTGTSRVVSPTSTTTYTLVAKNGSQSASRTATVTVNPVTPGGPTIDLFAATPASITAGQSSTLTWKVTNGDAVELDGVVQSTDSKSVTPAVTTEYTLVARKGTQTATRKTTVTVVPVLSTHAPVIVDFQVNPKRIQPGETATLSWNVTGNATVSVDGGLGVQTGTSITVSPKMSQVYTLTASNSQGTVMLSVPLSVLPTSADLYVAPGGSDTNTGTLTMPLASLGKALDLISKDTTGNVRSVMLRGGTYRQSKMVRVTLRGTQDKPIRILSYPGETAIIDGYDMCSNDPAKGWIDGRLGQYYEIMLYLDTSSWVHLYGIHFRRGPSRGILALGSQIVFEGGDTSFMGRNSAGGSGIDIRGEYLTVLNWDSHHNNDTLAQGGNSDGMGISATTGGNYTCKVYGCRFWNNADDAFDLYYGRYAIILERCWAFENGRDDAQGSISGTPGKELADGSGFKLGRTAYAEGNTEVLSYAPHLIQYNLSWKNKAPGFEDNGHPGGILLHHNTSWENGVIERAAVEFEFTTGDHVLVNNLAVRSDPNQLTRLFSTPTNARNNSWNLLHALSTNIFESVDDSGTRGARQTADGSLPDLPFLRPKASSVVVDKALPGLPYKGSAPDLGAIESK